MGHRFPVGRATLGQGYALGGAHGRHAGLLGGIPGGQHPAQHLSRYDPVVIHDGIEHHAAQVPRGGIQMGQLILQLDAPGVVDPALGGGGARRLRYGRVQIGGGTGQQDPPPSRIAAGGAQGIDACARSAEAPAPPRKHGPVQPIPALRRSPSGMAASVVSIPPNRPGPPPVRSSTSANRTCDGPMPWSCPMS